MRPFTERNNSVESETDALKIPGSFLGFSMLIFWFILKFL